MSYHIRKPNINDSELIMSYRNEFVEQGFSFDGCGRLGEFDDPEMWIKDCHLHEKCAGILDGWTNTFQYIYCDDEEIVGMIDYRTDIDKSPFLRMYGGNIGYSIRPSLRNKGIGKMMLRDFLLFIKNEFRVSNVVITCLKSNDYSKRMIVSCGGKYLDEIWYNPEKDYIERYSIEI